MNNGAPIHENFDPKPEHTECAERNEPAPIKVTRDDNGDYIETWHCSRCHGNGHLGRGREFGYQPYGICFNCNGEGIEIKRFKHSHEHRVKARKKNEARRIKRLHAKNAKTPRPAGNAMNIMADKVIAKFEYLVKKAEEDMTPDPIPGRRVLTGEVVFMKFTETRWGNSERIIIRLDSGEKVMGTFPKKLWNDFTVAHEADPSLLEGLGIRSWIKGKRITLTATVEVSDDPKYAKLGFYRRPSKASFL